MKKKINRLHFIIGVLLIHIIKLFIIFIVDGNIDSHIGLTILSYFLIISRAIGLIDDRDYCPTNKPIFKRPKLEEYYGDKNGVFQVFYIFKNAIMMIIGIILFFADVI